MQCKGRLVSKEEVYFSADGPRMHRNKPLLFLLPRRCQSSTEGDLCVNCLAKSVATRASLEKRGTKYIPNQGCLLHGNILEPIPTWSRLYKGAWWCKQLEDGYTMIKETEARATEAFEATHKDVDTPVDMKRATDVTPKPNKKMTRKKISAPVASVATPVVLPSVAPVIKPIAAVIKPPVATPVATPAAPPPVVAPKKAPKTRVSSKKTVAAVSTNPTSEIKTPVKITNPIPIVPLKEIEIEVVSIEIDGRKLWLDKAKDKVYDTKYNYLGRMKDDAIDSSFPDSDWEM